jgi:hypothetical protein
MDLGCEIGMRKTLTDYLDDLSGRYPDKNQLLNEQGEMALYLSDPSNEPTRPNGRNSFSNRGYSEKKDWYIYSNFNISYYFRARLSKVKL